ncbi:MAG: hypothetical protein Q8L27_02095 [archaeon]|nr:hypothetical protein [archaeon]
MANEISEEAHPECDAEALLPNWEVEDFIKRCELRIANNRRAVKNSLISISF